MVPQRGRMRWEALLDMSDWDLIKNRIVGHANTVGELIDILSAFPREATLHPWATEEDGEIIEVQEFKDDRGRLIGCTLEFNV